MFIVASVNTDNMKLLVLALCFVAAVSQPTTDYDRLHKHLFSNYTGRRPPLANASDTVTVMVDFAPVYLDVDDSGILEGSAWMVLMWKDPRLQFDPTEFGGIKKYNAPRWMVWMPDIVMHNSIEHEIDHPGGVTITPEGMVIVFPKINFEALCDNEDPGDIWDEKSCTIKYGSWVFDQNSLDIQMMPRNPNKTENDSGMYMKEFNDKLSPVKILSSSVTRHVEHYDCCPDEAYPQIHFTMKVLKKFKFTKMGIVRNPMMYKAVQMESRKQGRKYEDTTRQEVSK